ncbi:astacin [Teladorsagia circumcincta]|uniref:Metalloendopeptidase n=1 Tax=Teladorsagia circumcincta TaxID=45464 RepID=A0A2G9U7M2_TELCI|nr:astacin [Teladorsagia circumcincta]
MKIFQVCVLLLEIKGLFAQYIANDVVNDYAQVKELLEQYYRKFARKAGNDFVSDINRDPAVVRNEASSKLYFDGTEATVNRLIWPEVFENDIILTLPQAEALLKEAAGTRNKRQASPSPYSFWPNQTISYEFAYNDASFQNLIRSAIRHIEHNTCIRFKENGGDRDGLRYFRGNGCWSNVGRTGGRQLISIGYGCDALGIVAHETLHALGLWHEQSRDDRDQFIRVNFARIIREFAKPLCHVLMKATLIRTIARGAVVQKDMEESSWGGALPATQEMQTLKGGPVYANTNCIWRIRSPAGQKVELIINSVNFPCLDACASFIEIKAARSKTPTGKGSSDQREACNIQACPVTTVTKVEDKICSGRILLPCYLMERMTFGEDRQGGLNTRVQHHSSQFTWVGKVTNFHTIHLLCYETAQENAAMDITLVMDQKISHGSQKLMESEKKQTLMN